MNRDISLAGLKRTDLEKLSEVFRKHPAVEKASAVRNSTGCLWI